MAVQGKVREPKEWKKSTGFFEAEVLCINPDREKLESLLGSWLAALIDQILDDKNHKIKMKKLTNSDGQTLNF